MIDPRFYELHGPLSASDIASLVSSTVARGDPTKTVSSVASAAEARPDDLCFADEGADVGGTRAGVVLTAPGASNRFEAASAIIEVKHPRPAFARVASKLIRPREFEIGQLAIHPSAQVHATARLQPGAVIGPGAAIGAEVEIGANAVIGPGVQIGARTVVGAASVIRCALLGDSVRLYPGVVVGEAGFGLAAGSDGASLTPHFGRVIIQNGVSIGANSCVDRGLLDDTVIGEGTHIDNLCHIGHNCRIGSHVVMAAFAGVSGSSAVGDGVQFGGRVGLKDHVTIGAGARIAAGAAVLGDVPAAEVWAGYPAKPIRSWLRELAWLARSAQKRSTRND